jgi:hypothetical protein
MVAVLWIKIRRGKGSAKNQSEYMVAVLYRLKSEVERCRQKTSLNIWWLSSID